MIQIIEKYPLLTALVILFGVVLHWLWSNVISDKLAEISSKKIDKAISARKKLDSLYEANQYQLHGEMQKILRDCYGKGYRTTHDTSRFGFIYSVYKDIGGNHDGDILLRDFEKVALKDTMMLPLEDGQLVEMDINKYETVLQSNKERKNG